ncbi:MAG: DUF4126 domain-containing protein [Chthoniobacterales bacterium]|nr:DUF4126 domain-containing protein [Chthoniobacterales bacterium]
MEQLNLLGVALGLAALAGINLYLTVFVTGLAVNQHWIALAPQYQSLEVLGHPWIIGVAGVLYFLEFFADKIPWVDSAWDAVHTIIRPIGGALLGIQVLGHSSPTFDVIVLLLAGGTSLVAHTAKASTRLVANTSPEPFSNIGLSLVEDAAVFGGLALIHYNPVAALCVFGAALLALLYFAPKILRAMKAKIWLVFKKLNGPADAGLPGTLPIALPSNLQDVFSQQNVLSETIAWAVPCLSGKGRRVPANFFGALVATNEEPRRVVFVARKGGRGIAKTIELENCLVAREPKFLSENLVIFPEAGKGPKYLFVFPRSSGAMVEEAVEYLRVRLAVPPPSAAALPLPESEQDAEPVLQG